MTSTATTVAVPAPPAPPAPSPLPRRLSRLLLAGAVVSAVCLAVAVAGLVLDDRVLLGAPAWLKPAKFGISITAFLATLAWVLSHVRGHRRVVGAVAAVASVTLLGELAIIALQVVRGTTSHYNVATDLDGALWQAMGGLIGVLLVATVAATVLVLRQRHLDPGLAAGLRWGLLVALVGMVEAFLMVIAGAHTVGGPDGGPGLPVVGWSTVHGDLRVAHFVGLHALQALPLLAWLLLARSGLDARSRARVTAVAGAALAALVVLLAWQAERGQSVVRPDALTIAVMAALVVAAAVVGAAVARPRRTARRR